MAEHQGRPDQGLDVGILVTIRALLPNLAPVERRVAQIVLDDPAGVAETVRRAVGCGLAGCSIEDSTGHAEAPIYERGEAVERIRAAAEAAGRRGTRASAVHPKLSRPGSASRIDCPR